MNTPVTPPDGGAAEPVPVAALQSAEAGTGEGQQGPGTWTKN